MNKKNYFILIILLAVYISSCKKDSSTISSFTGYSYAPENIGHEIIYAVDSIVKSDFDGMWHSYNFQIKELIADTFTDNQGRPTLRLERYKRILPTDPWVIYNVWTANKTNIHYEKKEDNISYVKLYFPPSSTVTWNGNSLNFLDSLYYTYTSFNMPDTCNGLSFDSSLTVLQNDYRDIIDTIHFEERYAAGVGMYYKIQDSSHYNCCFENLAFDSLIFRKLYTEKIVSYSN
ncbi:MAG: hypothetical protein ABIT08_03525 [Bacteroidia bacterium]